MSGFPIIDLVVGMIFLYLLLSITTSSLVEVVMSRFRIRAVFLERWLLTIFNKKMTQPDNTTVRLGRAIMDHCMTTALAKPGKATSFMDADNFVSALIEKITFRAEDPDNTWANLQQIEERIKNAQATDGAPLLSTDLRRSILSMIAEARAQRAAATQPQGQPQVIVNTSDTASTIANLSEVDIFRKKLGAWFDSSMDRISGTMKRKYTRPITFIIAALLVICMNADSVALSRYLYSHQQQSANLSAVAAATAKDSTFLKTVEARPDSLNRYYQAINDNMPIGWQKTPDGKSSVHVDATKFGGWLLTVLAILMGAPFWFDLLNKVANVRGSGPKPASGIDDGTKAAKK